MTAPLFVTVWSACAGIRTSSPISGESTLPSNFSSYFPFVNMTSSSVAWVKSAQHLPGGSTNTPKLNPLSALQNKSVTNTLEERNIIPTWVKTNSSHLRWLPWLLCEWKGKCKVSYNACIWQTACWCWFWVLQMQLSIEKLTGWK